MNIQNVKDFLLNLQQDIISEIEKLDGTKFNTDSWRRELGGGGITAIIENGNVIERGGVNFSHVTGDNLPPSASLTRPELVGCSFQALGISLVFHPKNPFVPIVHLNIRFFVAIKETQVFSWWFGGGMDLTPIYGNKDDIIAFHRTCKESLDPFGKSYYPKFKEWCDSYFYIKHRNEPRGVGGIFFDDLCEPDFLTCFSIGKSVGKAFLPAYMPIISKRKDIRYGKKEREFQLYRRGRYVEFNLVYDRGTLFGLQSKGRTESILMSMPPLAMWRYNWEPSDDSPEKELMTKYLVKRSWVKI